MKCPECTKDLIFGPHINYDDISITEVDNKRIDIEIECNLENSGCGYKGFYVLKINDIIKHV